MVVQIGISFNVTNQTKDSKICANTLLRIVSHNETVDFLGEGAKDLFIGRKRLVSRLA